MLLKKSVTMLFCPADATTATLEATTDGAGMFAYSEFVLFYSAFFIYLAAKLAV